MILVVLRVWPCWRLTRCPRLEVHRSTTMAPSTSNLVVKVVAEVEVASLVMVLVVAVLADHQAVAVHLVVDNLGSSLDTLDILGNSLDLVVTMDNLGNSLDMVATLVAVMVARHLGGSLEAFVVVVVLEGVALGEVAPPRGKSSATGAVRLAISLPIVKRWW